MVFVFLCRQIVEDFMVKLSTDYIVDHAQKVGWQSVAPQYVTEALKLIHENKEDVPRYPNGTPTLKAVHQLATQLEANAAVKN